MHEFKTYLPIQLDGTCNGFQHLALLSNETRLFKDLNLAQANKGDRPKDFYEAIVNQLIIYIENMHSSTDDKEQKESCYRLLKLNLNRSNIKTAIMTIPYNASSTSLIKYILQTLEYSHGENSPMLNNKGELENHYLGWYKNRDFDGNINYVSYDDISLLVKYMNEIIKINYTKIKLLTHYLKDICELLNGLGLPVF